MAIRQNRPAGKRAPSVPVANGQAVRVRKAGAGASEGAEIRCIDLFCGVGGSTCGARLAGAKPVAGFDKWDLAIKAYELNNPGSKTYQHALEWLDPHEVAYEVGPVQLHAGIARMH